MKAGHNYAIFSNTDVKTDINRVIVVQDLYYCFIGEASHNSCT